MKHGVEWLAGFRSHCSLKAGQFLVINRNKTRGKVIKTSEKCFMHLNTAPELGSIGPNQTRRPFFGLLESSPLFGRVSVRETSEPAEHHEKRTLHPAVYLTLDHNNSINFTPERPQISKKKNVGFSSSGHSKSAFFKKPFWDLRQFRAGFSHICQLSGAPGNKWWIFTLPTEQKANPGRPFKKKNWKIKMNPTMEVFSFRSRTSFSNPSSTRNERELPNLKRKPTFNGGCTWVVFKFPLNRAS